MDKLKSWFYSNNSEQKLRAWLLPAFVIFITAAAGLFLPKDLYWISEPLHSTLEASGALIALGVGWFIIMFPDSEHFRRIHPAIPLALISMGILDAFHAVVSLGNNFVWLHSLATFVGGCLFVLSVFNRDKLDSHILFQPLFWTLVCSGLGVSCFLFPEYIPVMVQDGGFTFTAQSLNIIGGIFFVVACSFLAYQHAHTGDVDALLFAVLASLFGAAGILFELSTLWDAAWWWWHILRFAAYCLALYFLAKSFLAEIIARDKSQRTLEAILNNAQASISLKDQLGRYKLINRHFEKLFNLNHKEIIGKTDYDIFPKRIADVIHHNDREVFQQKRAIEYEEQKPHKKGTRTYLSIKFPVFDTHGHHLGTGGISTDITDKKQAEELLRESEEKYRGLIEHSPDSIVIVNGKGEIDSVNQQLLKTTGYSAKYLTGQPVEVLIPKRFINHTQQRDNFLSKPHIRMMGKEAMELFMQRKDGSEFPVEISLSPVETTSGLTILATIRDITSRKKADEKLNYEVSHDALTGLVNRREFERRAERLLTTVKQSKGEHALCFMDLDQFKIVNDTCGHAAGDELLRQLSVLLLNTLRHRDTLARLGGDEFGVLMEHCSLNAAHRVTTSLQKAIQDFQFTWQEHNFKVGASMGLVAITADTTDLSELLKEADAACYMAKDKGRNRIHVYHPEDIEIARHHGEMQWVTRINQALEEDRFCLYAQTIMPLKSSTDRHYELLLRMKDETGKIIPPGFFLPAAERYNLIAELDMWVIKNAFSILAANPAFLKQIQFISINLSGQSLTTPEILKLIVTQLKETGIPGNNICFEITETAAISNLSTASKFISTLKALGCRFALDDFGSGLSSFAYLKNLPVDYLKIDGMFVKDIADDPIDYAMVKSINEIGHVMNMKTIAEFVENDIIKTLLRKIGVDYVQGYGIGKPLPFDKLLDRTNSNVTDIKKSNKIMNVSR